MSGGILVASLSIVGLFLAFFFWKLGDESNNGARYPLQVIVMMFLLGIILLLGKTAVDYDDHCAWLVSNSTTTGSTTSYGYDYQCEENTESTASIFYWCVVWLVRMTTTYLVLAFAFEAIQYFGWMKRGGRQE